MQTFATLNSKKTIKSPPRHVTLRLKTSSINKRNFNSLTRKFKNQANQETSPAAAAASQAPQETSTESLDQSPMFPYRLTLNEGDTEEYNKGTWMIQKAENRAKYYEQYFENYMRGLDDSIVIEDEKIKGLIIHYPGQSALALDPTTELQYGIFPVIKATTTDINQPLFLITLDGFQQIRAVDLREKYEGVLSRIFTKS